MTYYKDITAEYEDIEDRYELMVERIRSITKEETVDMRYRDYFVRTGEFLLQLDKVIASPPGTERRIRAAPHP